MGFRITDCKFWIEKIQSDEVYNIIPQSKIVNPQSNHSANDPLF